MPAADYYTKLLQLNKELLKIELNPSSNQTFIEKLLFSLDKVLGRKAIMMASLSASGVKEITPNLVTHKVDFAFAQKLLVAYWNDSSLLDLSDDLFVLSTKPDYKNSTLYTELLRPYGYTDLMLQFIKDAESGRYLSYIIYLNNRGAFTTNDIEITAATGESIALAHLNSIYIWDLRNRINMLTDNMNYYPLGIMLVAKANQVVYINDIAKEYLKNLGVTDSRLYSTFYTNNIYPYYMHNMRSRSSRQPVRIGQYLFNVMPSSNVDSCPAVRLFSSAVLENDNTSELLNSINDITACVYMVRDSSQDVRFGADSMQKLGLTRRQQDIAEAVAQGLNNKELADRMGITENTVKTHLANIYKKLGINYRTELIDMLYKAQRQ